MKKKILIAILLSVAVIAAVVAVCIVAFKEDVVLTPDYAPPASEENAEKIEGEDGTKMDVAEGGGAVGMTYQTEVTIDLSDEKATLQFDNPGKSHNNVVVQIVVQGVVVAQSGTIKPGYRVRTMDLLDGAAERLAAGIYETNTKFVVLFYDPESDERSIIQTDIDIVVNVKA